MSTIVATRSVRLSSATPTVERMRRSAAIRARPARAPGKSSTKSVVASWRSGAAGPSSRRSRTAQRTRGFVSPVASTSALPVLLPPGEPRARLGGEALARQLLQESVRVLLRRGVEQPVYDGAHRLLAHLAELL